MSKSAAAEEIASRIRSSDVWDAEELRKLCDLAGMLEEYDAADGDTFEAIVYEAAERLGVDI